jgi:protoheme IX farnesyltransferase
MPPARGIFSTLVAFLELGKLRLSALAVLAVVAGLYMGHPISPPLSLALATTVGTLLVAIAANALNMYLERDQDSQMLRTLGRPLPAGRLTPSQVLWFGILTAGSGLTLMALTTTALATTLCALILFSYVLVYTPLKKVTTLNTLVGAVPGALPPVVGYVAAANRLNVPAAVLFLLLFFWQIPHFLAIAWRYREDYARSGMKMLPVSDPDGQATGVQMLVYTCGLMVASLLPFMTRMSGDVYLGAVLFLDLWFFVPVVIAAMFRLESAMRLCFLVSIVYLPLVLAMMVLDKIPQ